jgi:hypothetical protein
MRLVNTTAAASIAAARMKDVLVFLILELLKLKFSGARRRILSNVVIKNFRTQVGAGDCVF